MLLLVEKTLTIETVRKLFNGAALAVHVIGYHSRELCEELSGRLLQELDRRGGHRRIYQSNVRAFTETAADPVAREEYLSNSAPTMAALRRTCFPDMSPVDRLRCELDEIWPGGASLLRVGSRPLVFGMLRVWRAGAQALPHLDILGESVPGVPEASAFTEQIGANIYLRMPPTSAEFDGAVELWDLGAADVERRHHGIDGTYGYRRELLAEPTVTLCPAAGDLVLLRTTRIHAVRPTWRGERLTLSGFVGHVSDASSLRLWS